MLIYIDDLIITLQQVPFLRFNLVFVFANEKKNNAQYGLKKENKRKMRNNNSKKNHHRHFYD